MPDALTPPVRDMGVFARAVGVITSPTETFRAVVAKPRPAAILFLVCLVMSLALGIPQFTEKGRQATLDMQVQQFERFSGQPVSPEVYAQMEKRSHFNGYLTAGSMFIFLPVVSLIFAVLYWGLFNTILGGGATFKEVLAIVTHGQVIGALGAVLGAPIMYAQGQYTTNGPFTLGALAPMLESGFLSNFLSGIGVFTIWTLIVTAIGLGVLYKRRPGLIAIGLMLAYVAIVAAFTSAFSSWTSR